jgi:hypothetical protein
MRATLFEPAGPVILMLLVGMGEALGQPPGKGKGPQGPPDEEKEILKEIREAYKAPFEVHEDVLKELRKSYQQPSPDREAKIFRELRRLYELSADQEAAVLREIRRAYERPSAEQEERVFREIGRADRLPEGAVPPSVQAEQARKIFLRLDRNGDGVLSPDEMPDPLRVERARWDTNRDGFIDLGEYWAYYQGRLRSLSEQVASGQIELGLKRGGPVISTVPTPEEKPRPAVYRAGKLPPGVPSWFARLDTDGDGQIGLYEWKQSGRPLEEFFTMDRNGDGFLTIEELMHYLAQQPQNRSEGLTRAGTRTISTSGKR